MRRFISEGDAIVIIWIYGSVECGAEKRRILQSSASAQRLLCAARLLTFFHHLTIPRPKHGSRANEDDQTPTQLAGSALHGASIDWLPCPSALTKRLKHRLNLV